MESFLVNRHSGLERLSHTGSSSVYAGGMAFFFGAMVGVTEALFKQKPILKTSVGCATNFAVMASVTMLARDSVQLTRRRMIMDDKRWISGMDGAIAGTLTGYVACRLVKKGRLFSIIGGTWCGLLSGLTDALLSHAVSIHDP